MNYTSEPTEATPEVNFDKNSGDFRIIGKSFWENTDALYKPMLDWLEEVYLPNPADQTTLTIELDYFNTATAKALLGIFNMLARLEKNGKNSESFVALFRRGRGFRRSRS